MAWEEQLFAFLDDLEHQADALWDAERSAELADRSRAAYAEVPLAARLMAAVEPGTVLQIDVQGVGLLTGRLRRVASGWFLLVAHDHEWVIRIAAVIAVHDPPVRAVPEVAWAVVARLGLGSALRRLGEAGQRCLVHRVDGTRHEGAVRRVGADFAELAVGDDERVILIAFAAIAAIQSRD